MKHFILIFSALFLYSLPSTAQSLLLLPFKVNSPAFHEAPEAKIAISAMPVTNGFASSTFTINPAVDLAVSPIRHFSVIASFHSFTHQTVENNWLFNSSIVGSAQGYTIEGGIGAYGNFGKYGHTELLLIYGNGISQKHGRSAAGGPGQADFENYYGKYQSLAIQPAVGFSSRRFSLNGGLRYTVRKYNEFSMAGAPQEYMTDGTLALMAGFINFEAGNEFLRFTVQLGASSQAAGIALAGENNTNTYASIGFVSHFAPRHSAWYGDED